MKHETELIFDSLLPFLKSLRECAADSLDDAQAHCVDLVEYFSGKIDAFDVAINWLTTCRDTLKGINNHDRP